MSYFRSLSATLLSAAATFSLVTASSCGTNAVGVDDCRDIEQARCQAGASCLDANGAPLIEDAQACERYYRDHCLHGLATTPPAGASVSGCVQVIQTAGQCAKDDPNSPLACTNTLTRPRSGFTKACDVFAHPELALECAFLLDSPPVSDGSAGQGSGGESGSSTPTSAGAGQAGAAAAETTPGGAAP